MVRGAACKRSNLVVDEREFRAPKRCRILASAVLAAFTSGSPAMDAAAVPITLVVDTPQPSKQAGVVVGAGYTGSDTFDVTGTIDSDVSISGGIATGFDLEGASLSFSDMTMLLDPPVGGFGLFDVTATLLGPPALFTGSSGTTSSFDIAGSQLIFNSGMAIVSIGIGSGQLDLSTSPIAFDYGPGSIAELALTPLADGTLALSLLLPLDLSAGYAPPGNPNPFVVLSLSGDLAASRTIVPEPTTSFLLAWGLLGLALSARAARGP